jgi:PIN domain nuclease of toxin-antitoxin system
MILLDTHVWLWLASSPRRLSRAATEAIGEAMRLGGIAIASVSLLEIAWLMAQRRLGLTGTSERALAQMVDETGVHVRTITPAIAVVMMDFAVALPGDPVDRLIAATARAEGLKLVTRDRKLRASGLVETVW